MAPAAMMNSCHGVCAAPFSPSGSSRGPSFLILARRKEHAHYRGVPFGRGKAPLRRAVDRVADLHTRQGDVSDSGHL